ncbi:hypothetical protein [Microbacterium sp.]|uniref:hypothetical protein n=1 Tax=Microbacterium sp. TaxID=51671 RepID=UPI00356A3EDC
MTEGEQSNPWAQIVGPCYTETSVARALGWTAEQVAAAVESHSLLELETEEGVLLYPAFQIVDGRVVDGVGDVLRVLRTGTRSSWTWAQWLNSPFDDETGEVASSAIEQLLAGQIEGVLRDARHAAAAWSS